MKVSLYLGVLAFIVLMIPHRGFCQEVEDPDPNRFEEELQAFQQWDEKNAFPVEPVLFVGSSSIRFWKTHDYFPDLPVVNRGFGGAHISDVLHFVDRVTLRFAPEVIVFYAGDNDVAGGKSPQRVFDDYLQYLTAVREANPEVKVIFVAIKPSLSRWEQWPTMKEANALIEAHSNSDPHLFYADIATPMLLESGTPNPDLFISDGLHLNKVGYDVWSNALEPVLERALGE